MLTKTHIATLRKADDVYAHYHEGEHYLTAVKRATSADRERDPFAQDVTVRIPCEGTTRSYGSNGGNSDETVRACFAGSLWDTKGIWQVLREGDRVRLDWSRGGHTSDNLRAIDYVGDSLHVEIVRKTDTNGQRPLKFLGATYVGPNNSARLCRT